MLEVSIVLWWRGPGGLAGWVVNAVGSGRDGSRSKPLTRWKMAGQEAADEDEDKLGCKRVCLCCLDL